MMNRIMQSRKFSNASLKDSIRKKCRAAQKGDIGIRMLKRP